MALSSTIVLPERPGPRPRTTPTNPHQQLTQQASVELQEALWQRAIQLPHVRTGPSLISVPGARALFLPPPYAQGPPEAFMIDHEFSHMHPPYDGSWHMMLPLEMARQVVRQKWGEWHPVALQGYIPRTAVMIYGPQDEQEMETIWYLLQLSHQFARGTNSQE